MKSSRPITVALVAILQFIPPLLFPLETLRQIKVWTLVLPLGVFLLLGWGLLTRKVWSLTSTVFVQGFSVIVRLLSLLPGVIGSAEDGSMVLEGAFVTTSVLSIILSTVILYFIDRPEVQLSMQ